MSRPRCICVRYDHSVRAYENARLRLERETSRSCTDANINGRSSVDDIFFFLCGFC